MPTVLPMPRCWQRRWSLPEMQILSNPVLCILHQLGWSKHVKALNFTGYLDIQKIFTISTGAGVCPNSVIHTCVIHVSVFDIVVVTALNCFWLNSLVTIRLGDQFATLTICSPKICLRWPTTLGGLMPCMEVTSLQCRWVCSLQLLATWQKECQCSPIRCSRPQLLA